MSLCGLAGSRRVGAAGAYRKTRQGKNRSMRIKTQLLVVSLVLAGLSSMSAAGQTAWYYHVKAAGTGGKPVQSEADPGLASCDP